MRGIYDEPPKHYSSQLKKLIKAMIKTNPASRPSCTEIMNTETVKNKIIELGLKIQPLVS